MKPTFAVSFQNRVMRKVLLFAILLCGLGCSGRAGKQPQGYRKTLAQATEIQGYPCAKGYTWFYQGGQLQHCAVTREMPFGEAMIPAGSWIILTEDGKPEIAQMSHDAPVRGLQCRGGGLLGSAEGPMVAFYPSGKLKQCFLAADQTVQAVPCMKSGGIFGDRSVIGPMFYENGKLKSCTLSRDYGAQHKGDRFVQAP